MLNDFSGASPHVAYSFGINRDVAWDRDMASRSFDIFMYDHTINELPESNPRFHFHRQGITGAIKNPSLQTLEQLVAANGHSANDRMILKLDVEGAEWDVLLNSPSSLLARFSQIVIEMHDLVEAVGGQAFSLVRDALRKISETHQSVHVHANNYTSALILPGIVLPSCIEVSFVSRAVYGPALTPSKRSFPTAFDTSNCANRCDIVLGNLGANAAWRG
jgi:hypothetical protein